MRRSGPPLLVAFPLAVLVGSYLWLALDQGTAALWDRPVHESGRYTLGATILYFGHFLREIPVDVAMALFIVATLPATRGRAGPGRRISGWALAAALALAITAWSMAAAAESPASALRDLLQYRTRDDLEALGSHWRFHWLSTLWFGLAASFVAALIRPPGDSPRSGAAAVVGWAWFGALSVVFGLSAEIVVDPRFIGHQAREIFTHALITLPLSIGVLALVMPGMSIAPDMSALHRTMRGPFGVARLLALLAIPGYLGVATLTGDVMAAGQTEAGLAAMVAGHFFEHTLDYVFVVLLTLGLAPWLAMRPGSLDPMR